MYRYIWSGKICIKLSLPEIMEFDVSIPSRINVLTDEWLDTLSNDIHYIQNQVSTVHFFLTCLLFTSLFCTYTIYCSSFCCIFNWCIFYMYIKPLFLFQYFSIHNTLTDHLIADALKEINVGRISKYEKHCMLVATTGKRCRITDKSDSIKIGV